MNAIEATLAGLAPFHPHLDTRLLTVESATSPLQVVAQTAWLLAGGVEIMIFMVIGVVTIAVASVKISRWLEQKRTESWERVAHELGLRFLAVDDGTVSSQVDGFALFNKGHSRKLKNIIVADTESTSLAIFDYQYTTGSGKNAHTYRFTLVAMESQSLSLPHFTLRKEGLFDKIGAALGGQDIDFEEHAEFSSSFVLKSDNETLVREFFDTELLDFFAARPGIYIEARDSRFIYSHGGRRRPEEIRQTMSECFEIYKALAGE